MVATFPILFKFLFHFHPDIDIVHDVQQFLDEVFL